MVISGVVYSVGDWIAQVSGDWIKSSCKCHESLEIVFRPKYWLVFRMLIAVLWREAYFWNWSCTYVEIRLSWIHITWIPLSLLLSILRGTSIFKYFILSWLRHCRLLLFRTKQRTLLHIRHCFLSKIGGLFLPRLPLIRLFGQQFGIASTSQFWEFYVLNPLLPFSVNWRLHSFQCWL